MAPAVIVAVGVLALIVFVLFGVVIELLADVRQLRTALGILDRPLDVDLGGLAGAAPSSCGLPAALDAAGAALVLFLSDRCSTCHALADGFHGKMPAGLWVVLEVASPHAAREFLQTKDLTGSLATGRIIVDQGEEIATRVGLRTTPVGFRVEHGRLVSASTIPSNRSLSTLLGNRIRLEPTAAMEHVGRRAS